MLDSGVISRMFEDIEAPPLIENDENENDESDENDKSIWLCLCCHTVGGFDTEDELIAHHISHNVEYDDCYLCYIEAPNNGLEYDEANDSFLKRVQSVPSSTEICTAVHQVKTKGRKLGTTWSSEDCTVHAGVLLFGTSAAAQVGQGDDCGV